ncbi:MAG: Methylated-DNA-[protein]-cysteine S-methyltransferase DNA binding protein [uncultured bacterium (gcode 4)]|uniref:Methylated-DNA-[protein]-cysteine S-methyltransferase DNA binding protein n=1 Tax=uncultured bacterium (gcode 4) TaxID=1234023 RepID=K2GVX4_9BACT|nr:MAG: Methylated-DNA-[protein]-cysteine S-methyltransferase DNA binding protein [uncultured bacterium (gcode 4)]
MNMKEEIYIFLASIPAWKIVSYKIIWERFGIHPRYVARIMASNKNPDIYPCYKVINADWKIWWYNLWVEEKIRRLEKDRIEIIDWKIGSSYFWNLKDR